LIWPDEIKPDFTKKTISHYGLIVSTVEEAITAINQSWKAITEHEKAVAESQRRDALARMNMASFAQKDTHWRNCRGFDRG